MKKFVMVLAVAAAACTSGNGTEKKPSPKAGGACDELNATACQGNLPLVCDGTTWAAGTDCGPRGLICVNGECTTSSGGPRVGDACSQLNDTNCDGTRVIACDGSNWVSVGDCATNSLVCAPNGTCVSADPGAEFEACDPTRATPCEGSLVCEESTYFGGAFCMTACTSATDPLCDTVPNASGTPVPGYCHNTGLIADSGNAACWYEGARGTVCIPFAPDTACEGDATCDWNFLGAISDTSGPIPTSFECKLGCPGGNVNNGQGGCPTNEECLAGPTFESEPDGANDKTCSNPGTTDNCDSGGQYSCVTFADGNFCARPIGWCGGVAPLIDTATDLTDTQGVSSGAMVAGANGRPDWIDQLAVDEIADDGGHMCNQVGYDYFCKADAVATAEIECTELGTSLWGYGVDCQNDAQCSSLGTGCVELAGGGAQCAESWRGCVAFCDDPAGGPDLSCPGSMTCQDQDSTNAAHALGPWRLQGTTSAVACTVAGDPGSPCDADHVCTSFGGGQLYCANLRKVCSL